MKKIIFFLLFGSSAYAATPLGGTISAPNSTGGSGGSNTTINAGSNITIVTNSPSNITISSTGGGSGIATNNGAGTGTILASPKLIGASIDNTTAPSINTNIGIMNFGTSGAAPYHYEGYRDTKPSFQGQLGEYNPSALTELYLGGSTATGDWLNAFAFPTGIQTIGDQDNSGGMFGNLGINFDGGASHWNDSGDAGVLSTSWSGNSNNSGSAFIISVMGGGFGITNYTIVSGGSGYHLGDDIHLTGGTLSGAGGAAILVVNGVSGTVVTSMRITASGEYHILPSGTITPTTGESGTGLTMSVTGTSKGVHELSDNSVAFLHSPANRVAGLTPSWASYVFNLDPKYNKGWSIESPSIGFGNGNYMLACADGVDALFGVPFWVNGVFDPQTNGWKWALVTSPSTGVTTALSIVATNVTAPVYDKGGAVYNIAAYGAIAGTNRDSVVDNRAIIQSVINLAITNHGTVFIPPGYWGYSNSLLISNTIAMVGEFSGSAYGKQSQSNQIINMPVLSPYLVGSILVPMTPGSNAINVTVAGGSINIHDLGILWQTNVAGVNTGDGIYGLPPLISGSSYEVGISCANIDRVKIWGVDGNHYGIHLVNSMLSHFNSDDVYGGGMFLFESSQNYGFTGNHDATGCFNALCAAGTSHGIYIKNDQTNNAQNRFYFANCQVNGAGVGLFTPPTSSQFLMTADGQTTCITVNGYDFENDGSTGCLTDIGMFARCKQVSFDGGGLAVGLFGNPSGASIFGVASSHNNDDIRYDVTAPGNFVLTKAGQFVQVAADNASMYLSRNTTSGFAQYRIQLNGSNKWGLGSGDATDNLTFYNAGNTPEIAITQTGDLFGTTLNGSIFNSGGGTSSALSTGGSPWTFTWSGKDGAFIITGGVVTGVTINGVTVPTASTACWTPMRASDVAVITYTGSLAGSRK